MAQEYIAAISGLPRLLRAMHSILILISLRKTVVNKEHVFIKTLYLCELIAASAKVKCREDIIRFYIHMKIAFLVNFSKGLGDLYTGLENALNAEIVCAKGGAPASSHLECVRISNV